jgi:signal transduction histidine kinase
MFSIKTKQVASVTGIVGLSVILLSMWYVSSLASVRLAETQARAELLVQAIQHRMFDVVAAGGILPDALRADAGLASIVQASAYDDTVVYAAIVDPKGLVITHSDPASEGKVVTTPVDDLTALIEGGPVAQAQALYSRDGKTFEYRSKPLLVGTAELATIRVGVSTLLIREKLVTQMLTPLITSALAILAATFVAMLLAQVTLRPIHVIRTGLARLGRGELDVKVDLPEDEELAELGDSFKAVTARLAADRTALEDQKATLESVVDTLEDAVALFGPTGLLLFANPAMQPSLKAAAGDLSQVFGADHPYRPIVAAALDTRTPSDQMTVQMPGGGERLVHANPVEDAEGDLLGVMLVSRNLTYLSQVESTLAYSRKLAALGRLSAGIAHEVKNPLNATMIHLELLKMQVAETPSALEHVAVIAAQVRRLDEVVQGFLKFTRPEDLQLRPVEIPVLFAELMPVISAEAAKHGIDIRTEFAPGLPPVQADAGMLQQAFLNLALNACQAMPSGGRLRIAGTTASNRRVAIVVEDTGVGIPPEHLARIFDLYFTTKEHGSGIGLSLVYRTVQLHDGEIEVQSVPGRGTTFRIMLPAAARSDRRSGSILGLGDVVAEPTRAASRS